MRRGSRQFNGHSLQQMPAAQWRVKKDGGKFDFVTGATISASVGDQRGGAGGRLRRREPGQAVHCGQRVEVLSGSMR